TTQRAGKLLEIDGCQHISTGRDTGTAHYMQLISIINQQVNVVTSANLDRRIPVLCIFGSEGRRPRNQMICAIPIGGKKHTLAGYPQRVTNREAALPGINGIIRDTPLTIDWTKSIHQGVVPVGYMIPANMSRPRPIYCQTLPPTFPQ